MVKKNNQVEEQCTEPFGADGDDIVVDILRMVIQMAPTFSQALAAQVEHQIKERWGGDRPYIPKPRLRMAQSQRNDAIRRDYLAGERIGLLERRYGLKKTRIWEILKS